MQTSPQLADRIERFLLDRAAWVPVREICERFDVPERRLRALGDRHGLCTAAAISGDHGLKHVACATTAEWLQFKHRMRHHAIGELVRARDMDRRRQQVLRARRRPAATVERDTGQVVATDLCPEPSRWP